jgi:hypothetical protein
MSVGKLEGNDFQGYSEKNLKNLYAKKVSTNNGIRWEIKRTDNPKIKRVYHNSIGKLLGNQYKHGKELKQLPVDSLLDNKKLLSLKTISAAFSTEKFDAIGEDVSTPFIEGFSKEKKENVSESLSQAKTDTEARAVYGRVKTSWNQMLASRPKLKELNLTAMDNILSVGGLNLMIEQLKSKPGMEDAHCFVCESVDDLQDCMEALKGSSFEGKVAFFVRSANFRDSELTPHHVTPVLVEKKGGETSVMIMDSLGNKSGIQGKKDKEGFEFVKKGAMAGNKFFVHMYANNVYMKLVESQTPDMKIYVANRERQKDTTNCPIFSLNDVKMFFKNKEFFEELDQFGGIVEFEGDPDVRMVANLPPESMKVAQSFTEIDKYLDENDPSGKSSWFKAEGAPRERADLDTSLAKGTRASSGKKVNMKAEDRFHKYLHVMQQVCESHTDAEVAELSTRYSSKHVTPELLSSLARI